MSCAYRKLRSATLHQNATLLHFAWTTLTTLTSVSSFLSVVTVRKEVAEKVGIGFEFPTQSSVVAPNAPNAPKKSTNLQK
jgi:hypothetical protein